MDHELIVVNRKQYRRCSRIVSQPYDVELLQRDLRMVCVKFTSSSGRRCTTNSYLCWSDEVHHHDSHSNQFTRIVVILSLGCIVPRLGRGLFAPTMLLGKLVEAKDKSRNSTDRLN